jgi:putative ABC transport system permease protein
VKVSETLKVSCEGLIANKLRSLLTVLGVIIGVASIVLLTSLSLEVKSQVTGSIKSLGSNIYFVFPADPNKQMLAFAVSKLRTNHAKEMAQKSSYGIVTAPIINKGALVKYGKLSRGTTVMTGTTPDFPLVREWKRDVFSPKVILLPTVRSALLVTPSRRTCSETLTPSEKKSPLMEEIFR